MLGKRNIKTFCILTGIGALMLSATFSLVQGGGSSNDAKVDANVNVIKSIAIDDKQALNFGKIIPPPSGQGLATVLSSSDNVVVNNGATIYSDGSTTRAEFEVSGHEGAHYNVELPDDNEIEMDSGNISLKYFQIDKSSSNLNLGSTGDQTINLGATIEIDASTSPGNYSEEFKVKVNYI